MLAQPQAMELSADQLSEEQAESSITHSLGSEGKGGRRGCNASFTHSHIMMCTHYPTAIMAQECGNSSCIDASSCLLHTLTFWPSCVVACRFRHTCTLCAFHMIMHGQDLCAYLA